MVLQVDPLVRQVPPDAQEMAAHLAQAASDASAVRVVVRLAVDFPELFPEPVRDFHPSALADVPAPQAALQAQQVLPPQVARSKAARHRLERGAVPLQVSAKELKLRDALRVPQAEWV
jgi:hypothetical protein